jgi:glycosyltransferase involved in cell wall biosynthesis
MIPKVSFIVPCYKLGHLLAECVDSILAQSYQDFEVLIMDDNSPDNTSDVAGSFKDARVRHIRNEPNLGHLQNYNKGISLARGEYIWLISADDRLRSAQVLERYVGMLDRAPNVGFVFCPAMRLIDDCEAGVMPYSLVSDSDVVFGGHNFLVQHLVFANIVPAPAAMARKKCYERMNSFPLDLPHTGDWYLWSMFSLYFDVGFCAEPMVNRRFHTSNMSTSFCTEAAHTMFANNLAVPLRILERARQEGFSRVAESCKKGIVSEYLRQVTPAQVGDPIQTWLSDNEFEGSLATHITDKQCKSLIQARVYAGLADYYYDRGRVTQALHYYRRSLQQDRLMLKVWAKYFLLQTGAAGTILRARISRLKRGINEMSEKGCPKGVTGRANSDK